MKVIDFLSGKILQLGATIKCFLNRTHYAYCLLKWKYREPYFYVFLSVSS